MCASRSISLLRAMKCDSVAALRVRLRLTWDALRRKHAAKQPRHSICPDFPCQLQENAGSCFFGGDVSNLVIAKKHLIAP
jgi:hypothetical protein